MSKYYKAEDVIAFLNLHCPKDMWEYQIADLPTIEVSEDCISREWVHNILTKYVKDYELNELDSWQNTIVEWIATDIEDAPSVVPSRAEGEWILECDAEGEGDNLYRCPECGQECGCQEYDLPNYCGNCGAKMKGADDDTD